MDKLERELKRDAEAIRADVSPELAARLDASIRATVPVAGKRRRSRTAFAWWWLSSLSGVAAVFLLIVFLNRGESPSVVPDGQTPVADDQRPVTVVPIGDVPLEVRTVEFAEPLADELENLKSDLEKAREKLASDLRLTL